MNTTLLENLQDVLTTAAEVGSKYWLRDTEIVRNRCVKRADNHSITEFTFDHKVDNNGWNTITITPAKLAKLITNIQTGTITVPNDIKDACNGIADSGWKYTHIEADELLQLAVFHKIIFG